MPGFAINSPSGDNNANPSVEPRRRHRWTMNIEAVGNDAWIYLRTARRPNFKFDPVEMHHNQEVAYFAGKQSWDPIEVSWYDAEDPDVSASILDWVGTVNPSAAGGFDGEQTVNPPGDYKGSTVILNMLDGAGTTTETWELLNCWPLEVNWGDLDYTNSEILEISLTMRFDRAVRRSGG